MMDNQQFLSNLWSVSLTVNGIHHERSVEPRLLLSDFLRHELNLTGTHVGCEHGSCGACTVLMSASPAESGAAGELAAESGAAGELAAESGAAGELAAESGAAGELAAEGGAAGTTKIVAVRSCILFAVQVDGHEITTVEGLAADDGRLHPLQEAFRETHGLQCGYCTPGFLMTLVPFLQENPQPTEAEIREAISGNLCRCTGYQNIVEAVKLAARNISHPE
jgi:carbon-monoxide dehydrogenase small subunit